MGAYLWCGHVSGGPGNECYCEGGGLLGLSGDVAGDEGEDQVTFGKVELRAVEGDEKADTGAVGWGDGVHNCSSDDWRTVKTLAF